MNLLFPFFMLGLAAIAIPIVLHFRRQPPQKSVPFSSLMFLEATPVPPRTRRKLEDWLLLLLRCLALALIALMFGRPFLRTPGETLAADGTSWCVLLDTSASMKREGAWKAAQVRLGEVLATVREQDSVMLATFDRGTHELLGFDAWQALPEGGRKAELKRVFEGVQPTWLGTDLGGALRYAAARFQGNHAAGSRRQRIVLVSDLQEGAGLEALHADSWPDKLTVTTLAVDAPWKDNLTLSPASSSMAEETAVAPVKSSSNPNGLGQTRVRVTSSRDSAREKFSLVWQGEQESVQASVPVGGTRILPAPDRADASRDGVLQLGGDALDFDNRLYVAHPKPRELRLLCIGTQLSRSNTSSPLFYLVRALQPSATLKPVVVEKEATQFSAADLPGTAVVFVFGDLPEATLPLLKEWASAGGSVVNVAQSGDRGSVLQALTGWSTVTLSEAISKEALLQDLKFDHITLRSFAEAGVRDFSKIRFWKHRALQLPPEAAEKAQVLARFDDQTPAWLEVPAGQGRLIYLAAGWAPSDSQLAVSSKFVPLLYGLLDWATGGTTTSAGLVVGDTVPASLGNWQDNVSVTGPDGKTVMWEATRKPIYDALSAPGFYKFGKGESAVTLAVNLAPSEGRLAPLAPEKLSELGVKLEPVLSTSSGTISAMEQVRLEDAREEQRQKVWKAFLVAALVVLLLETWLAGRREGRSRQPEMQTA
ncbi:MAG: BatA domain-containing protein [Verrucomicrobium sp.]|nr:BatA domain-containing protein [Verrucomicrobium sp.]